MASPSPPTSVGDPSSAYARPLHRYGDDDDDVDNGATKSAETKSSYDEGATSTTGNPSSSDTDATEDDGWEYKEWPGYPGYYYYYNRFTGVSQWENPRVPEANTAAQQGTAGGAHVSVDAKATVEEDPFAGIPQYNPKIHGSFNWNEPYAARYRDAPIEKEKTAEEQAKELEEKRVKLFEAQAAFNAQTGSFQNPGQGPSNYSSEARAGRQLNGYFDHAAWEAKHNGKSLKEERQKQRISKKQLKEYKERREQKKRRNIIQKYGS